MTEIRFIGWMHAIVPAYGAWRDVCWGETEDACWGYLRQVPGAEEERITERVVLPVGMVPDERMRRK